MSSYLKHNVDDLYIFEYHFCGTIVRKVFKEVEVDFDSVTQELSDEGLIQIKFIEVDEIAESLKSN